MSGLQVGEQGWDTIRTETGGVGPRDDRACEPIPGPSPAVELGSDARSADEGITGCLCRGGETKQMGPDRPTGDGRGLVHKLSRVRRPNSGYQALISPLNAQQTRINDLVDPPPRSSPSTALRSARGRACLQQGPGPQAPEKPHPIGASCDSSFAPGARAFASPAACPCRGRSPRDSHRGARSPSSAIAPSPRRACAA